MRLACSTRGLDLYPDRYGHASAATRARTFQWAKHAGFSVVEMEDRWANAEELAPEQLKDLASAAADADITLTLKLHYRDLHTKFVATANERSVLQAIHAAEALNAPMVSIGLATAPTVQAEVSRALGRPWNGSGSAVDDAAFERTAAALQRLADAAVDSGIDLSIELHQQSIVDTSKRLVRLLELVDYANVGANPDLANNLQTEPAPAETWREALDRLAPHTNYWHVKNLRRIEVPGGSPVLLRRALHEGEIDYRWAMAVMRQAGFDGIIVVEGPGSGDHLRAVAEGRHYLTYLMAELDAMYA